MNQKKITPLFFTPVTIIMMVLLAGSCYYDKSDLLYPGSNGSVDCNTVPATFNANVLPLINSKCYLPACHDGTASGGFVFQNYAQVSGAADRINTSVVQQKTMPPSGALLPSEINIIKCWIENGAPNN